MKNLIVANLEENLCLTECVKRALKVMRFTRYTGLKLTPFELHHGRKLRSEITYLVEDGKSIFSDWTHYLFQLGGSQKSQSMYRAMKKGMLQITW